MARTPLFCRIQQLYRHYETNPTSRRLPSRRDFFKTAIGAAAVARAGAAKPRIAIIGAGIAGLNAALTLQTAGFPSTIYEASSRVGGRMHSDTTTWANNQFSEHCGELIDSGHTTILQMARQFGIPLIDVLAAQPANSTETYFFNGQYYSRSQAVIDFAPVYHNVRRDANAAGFPTLYNSYKHAGLLLDQMSVYQWIEANVPGGHGSPMGQLLDVAYDIEYGARTTEQSSLNLIYLLAFQSSVKDFALFGTSDEHYKMQGGNERLPRAIAAALPAGSIQLNTSLKSIARLANDTYRLEFKSGSANVEVTADHVILAIPFSILRRLDYSQAGFNSVKVTGIQQLGYGSNAKLALQFREKVWNQSGPWGLSTGTTYADTGYQNTWEVTRGQPGASGILVDYLGSGGAALTGNPANSQVVQKYAQSFLTQLESVFPGITAHWNGKATLDTPLYNPFLLGSYSNWKVGQYTLFSGSERERSNTCHFAGEHCSINFQGYMEGGAEEGARAANEIIVG